MYIIQSFIIFLFVGFDPKFNSKQPLIYNFVSQLYDGNSAKKTLPFGNIAPQKCEGIKEEHARKNC